MAILGQDYEACRLSPVIRATMRRYAVGTSAGLECMLLFIEFFQSDDKDYERIPHDQLVAHTLVGVSVLELM